MHSLFTREFGSLFATKLAEEEPHVFTVLR